MTVPEPVPVLKAAGVNSMIGVLSTMAPKPRFAAWVKTLPRATASLVDQPRLPQSWIPLADINPLWTHSLDGLFEGDMQRLYELGRLQLRADMSGIYRVFLRVASPGFVADRAGAIYSVYGQHCGTLRVLERFPRGLLIAVAERPLPSLPLYEYLRGTIAGALELTGVVDLQVQIVGEPKDNERHYRATWA